MRKITSYNQIYDKYLQSFIYSNEKDKYNKIKNLFSYRSILSEVLNTVVININFKSAV